MPADLTRLGISKSRFNHWSHRQTHDVAIADAVVLTPGHGGTLGELGNAQVLKKPVAVLEPPGADNAKFNRAMRALRTFYRVEKSDPPIRFFKSPDKLASWVMQQAGRTQK